MSVCMCGNSFKGDGVLPKSMCSGKCPGTSSSPLEGNATLTCGAQWNIGELYNTSVVATGPGGGASSSGDGGVIRLSSWQGEFGSAKSSRSEGIYAFGEKMLRSDGIMFGGNRLTQL